MNISNEYVAKEHKEKGDVVPSFLQRVRKEQIIFKKSNLVSPPIKPQDELPRARRYHQSRPAILVQHR